MLQVPLLCTPIKAMPTKPALSQTGARAKELLPTHAVR